MGWADDPRDSLDQDFLPERAFDRSSELDEFLWILRQIEPFFVRNGPDSPLLHGERTEQNLDRPALFVVSNLFDD